MKKDDTDIVKWFERLSDEINQIYDSTNTIQDDFRRECVFIARAQSHITNNWTVSDISLYRKLPELEVYYDNDAIFRLVHVLTDELSERAYLVIGIYAASGMFGNGIDAKRPDEQTGLPYTIDATPFAERTLKDLESNLPNDFSKRLFDTMKNEFANLQGKVDNTQAGVSFLVHDRMGKQAANSKRGKESHGKADDAESQRAKRDIETALERVAADPYVKAGKHGAILAACRRVCKRFTPLTGAKKNGRIYLSLTKADGKPLTPETLARYYREKHKGKRGKK